MPNSRHSSPSLPPSGSGFRRERPGPCGASSARQQVALSCAPRSAAGASPGCRSRRFFLCFLDRSAQSRVRWIEHAEQVSVRRLYDDVDRALSAGQADLQTDLQPDRQTCAKTKAADGTHSEPETARFFFAAPPDVASCSEPSEVRTISAIARRSAPGTTCAVSTRPACDVVGRRLTGLRSSSASAPVASRCCAMRPANGRPSSLASARSSAGSRSRARAARAASRTARSIRAAAGSGSGRGARTRSANRDRAGSCGSRWSSSTC